jgi:hypothetical protein
LTPPEEATRGKAFWWGAALAAILTAYALAILVKTSFISDDAYESQLRGGLALLHQTLPERIFKSMLGWILEAGRVAFVTWWYRYPLFYYVREAWLFKTIGIGIILTDVTLFGYFLSRLTRSAAAGLLVCFLVPTFFQFRAWHDPFLAFVFVVPFQMAMITLSLLAFERSLDRASKRTYVGSLLLWFLALGTGELSYTFAGMPLVVAKLKGATWARSLRLTIPFVMLGIAVVAATVILKSPLNPHYTAYYAGVKARMDLAKQWQTFLIQAWAAFPLSYYLRMATPLKAFFKPWDTAFVILIWTAATRLFHRASRAKGVIPTFLAMGASYALLPVLPLTLSATYQESIPAAGWGFGYIPVYLQYFGAFLLLAGACLAGVRAFRFHPRALWLASGLVAIPFAAFAGINLAQNRAVALGTQPFYTYPRQVLAAAFRSGLLAEVPEDGFILHERRFPSDHPWMIAMESAHHPLSQEPTTLFQSPVPAKPSRLNYSDYPTPPLYLPTTTAPRTTIGPGVTRYETSALPLYAFTYQYDAQEGKRGLGFGAKITAVIYDETLHTLYALETENIDLYEFPSGRRQKFTARGTPYDFLRVMKAKNDAPVPIEAWRTEPFLASSVYLQWGGSFLDQDGNSESNVRWCGSEGELNIFNASNKPVAAHLVGAVAAGQAEPSELQIESSTLHRRLSLSNRPQALDIPITLPAGGTKISFRSNGRPLANGDPRNLVFGLFNFRLLKVDR